MNVYTPERAIISHSRGVRHRWLNSTKGTKIEIGFYLRPFRP
jgi:hypothetical protein